MDKFNCYTEEFNKFAPDYTSLVDALRAYGHVQYKSGLFQQAVYYFKECIAIMKSYHQVPNAHDYNFIYIAYFALQNYTAAEQAIREAIKLEPGNYGFWDNLGHSLLYLLRFNDAIECFEKSLKIESHNLIALDGLAWAYGLINNVEKSGYYGKLSLIQKDKTACSKKNIKKLLDAAGIKSLEYDKTIKKFNPEQSHRNIISFSLWGENLNYTDNAIKNAILAKVIYPGWRCRFYCDNTVSDKVKSILLSLDAEVINMQSKGPYYGLFWRFFVMSDPEVDFFLIRDCDSLLNCQERVAVDEWLNSNTCFHIIRDFCSQTDLIHAGLFGGIANLIPNLNLLIDKLYEHSFVTKIIDQIFTRYCLWPFVKQSYLAHDSCFNYGHSKPFPLLGRFPKNTFHIGQNWDFDKKGIFVNCIDDSILWRKLQF